MVQSGKKSPFSQICEADKNKVTEGAGNMSVKTQKMGLNEKILHMPKVVDSLGEVLTLFFLPCCVSEMSALPLFWGGTSLKTLNPGNGTLLMMFSSNLKTFLIS